MDIILRGGSDGVTITVRRFMVPEDIDLVYKWSAFNFGGWLWKEKPPIDEITDIFKSIQESDIAQAFIVEADAQTPVFEIDIHGAETDLASGYYAAELDDYTISLLFPPAPDEQLVNLGVATCIEYFFLKSTLNINRIIVPVYKQDRFLYKLLEEAGFEPLKLTRKGGYHRIYALSKGAFLRRQLHGNN